MHPDGEVLFEEAQRAASEQRAARGASPGDIANAMADQAAELRARAEKAEAALAVANVSSASKVLAAAREIQEMFVRLRADEKAAHDIETKILNLRTDINRKKHALMVLIAGEDEDEEIPF